MAATIQSFSTYLSGVVTAARCIFYISSRQWDRSSQSCIYCRMFIDCIKCCGCAIRSDPSGVFTPAQRGTRKTTHAVTHVTRPGDTVDTHRTTVVYLPRNRGTSEVRTLRGHTRLFSDNECCVCLCATAPVVRTQHGRPGVPGVASTFRLLAPGHVQSPCVFRREH